MGSRAEVTSRYAKAYVKAGKADKGRVLDQVVEVTGWSRDNARRRLVAAGKQPPGAGRQVAVAARKRRASKYSYDALKVLQRVWAASGGQCGKYLTASMRTQRDALVEYNWDWTSMPEGLLAEPTAVILQGQNSSFAGKWIRRPRRSNDSGVATMHSEDVPKVVQRLLIF